MTLVGSVRITGCPILLGESQHFLLFLTVECMEPSMLSCDTSELAGEVSRLLASGSGSPRAIATVYGGLTLFYKSRHGPVPISRAQLSVRLCVGEAAGSIMSSDWEILEVVAEAFTSGRLGRRLTGLAGSSPISLEECADSPCRPAPTGVSYG